MAVFAVLAVVACIQQQESLSRDEVEADVRAQIQLVLNREMNRIDSLASIADDILHPVQLLSGSQETALRRYSNSTQLARARSLGVQRLTSMADLAVHEREGRLVRLEDTTRYWAVRELDYSVPFVIPDVKAVLTEIGERFHARLHDMGLPLFRMEITSVLRTPQNQADLRGVNRNATRSVSTHEFGTTIDVAYSSFAAPEDAGREINSSEEPWLESHLQRIAAYRMETVAARRSRELQAILGEVLIEMQNEGKVMVTLEQRQPVYHMTVAKRF